MKQREWKKKNWSNGTAPYRTMQRALVTWIIVGTMFSVASSMLTCGSCEGGSSIYCPNSWEYQFFVSLYPSQEHPRGGLKLQCDYETRSINLTVLEGCSFDAVTHVRIEQCPLFDEPLGKVLQKVGINAAQVTYLVWGLSHSIEAGLQSWHLHGLDNLTFVEMQSNYFESIPSRFFENNPNLKQIYLTDNSFTSLPEDFLSYTPDVRILNMRNNEINILPDNFLANVPKLETLTLSSNALSKLPDTFLSNNSLITAIILASNRLTEVHSNLFNNLTKLKKIDLQNNKLIEISNNSFSGCQNLSTILLQYNQISVIPVNLFTDTNIEVLNLGSNNISEVDGLFHHIPTLQNLTLHVNKIRMIPSTMFRGTHNLIKLDLQANQIETIETETFENLSNLKILILNRNLLNSLPSGLFRGCVSLQRLFLQNNNISDISKDCFPKYSDLRKIILSHNQLVFHQFQNPLNNLVSIEEIDLSYNKIDMIFSDALQVFTKLKLLNLEHNRIDFLSDYELVSVSKNITINLKDNKISTIRTSQLLGYGNNMFITIHIAGNPLHCNCDMYYFLKGAHMTSVSVTSDGYNLIIADGHETICTKSYENTEIPLDEIDVKKLVCDYDCSEECKCHRRVHDKVIHVDCSNMNMCKAPTFLPHYQQLRYYNLSLDLSNNRYINVSFLENPEYENLVNLNLSRNKVSSMNYNFLPPKLQLVDLSYNNISHLSETDVSYLGKSSMFIYLGHNPWTCDCALDGFHSYLRDNFEQVMDRGAVLCSSGVGTLEDLVPEELCSSLLQPAALSFIIIVTFLLLTAAVLCTAAWYRNKELVKVWLYTRGLCLWAVTETEIDADKKYDAFVSYSYKDEPFVNDLLVPGLENGDPKYHVCLHYRDWVPGEFIQDQILTSVKASRRTIVVLSENFLKSVWGQQEFKVAHSQAMKDKTNRIIVVVYGEVPDKLDGELSLYVSSNTYLKWGDTRFWERLKYAMPHRVKRPGKQQRVPVENHVMA